MREEAREEIMNKIVEAVRKEVGPEFEVMLHEIKRNNGKAEQTVFIRSAGMDIGGGICLEEMLRAIECGELSIQKMAPEIAASQREQAEAVKKFSNISKSITRDFILDKATYYVVSTERNRERLQAVPHKEFLDLSTVYQVIVSKDQQGLATLVVPDWLCEIHGISLGELDAAARRNTERNGFCVESLDDTLARLTGMPKGLVPDGVGLWNLTNADRLRGAAVLLYKEHFAGLAQKLDSDLYVLPSSVHEVLAVSAKHNNPEALRKMVLQANDSVVAEDEFLSNNVYKYSCKNNEFTIV